MIYFFFLQQKKQKTIGSSYTMSVLAGIVGPILNSIFHVKDLPVGNNDNFLFCKTSLYDILRNKCIVITMPFMSTFLPAIIRYSICNAIAAQASASAMAW